MSDLLPVARVWIPAMMESFFKDQDKKGAEKEDTASEEKLRDVSEASEDTMEEQICKHGEEEAFTEEGREHSSSQEVTAKSLQRFGDDPPPSPLPCTSSLSPS
eukprot:754875-Hanusia_phi.AAC.2